MSTVVKVQLFHTMLLWYKDTISSFFLSFPLLLIMDIQIVFIVLFLRIEQIGFFIYWFQIWEDFFY